MIEEVRNEILQDIEIYKNNSEDYYDFWNEHIKYVYDEAINLAELYNADRTIVELGALLHDIALIKKVGDRKDHHINGAELAREILKKYNCPQEILERVIGCVLNHRSSKNATNIEELCVADADILAHFDNIPMLFNSAFVRNNIKLNEVRDWLKECFEKDYNDLSDNTKKIFSNRYNQIFEIILKDYDVNYNK